MLRESTKIDIVDSFRPCQMKLNRIEISRSFSELIKDCPCNDNDNDNDNTAK